MNRVSHIKWVRSKKDTEKGYQAIFSRRCDGTWAADAATDSYETSISQKQHFALRQWSKKWSGSDQNCVGRVYLPTINVKGSLNWLIQSASPGDTKSLAVYFIGENSVLTKTSVAWGLKVYLMVQALCFSVEAQSVVTYVAALSRHLSHNFVLKTTLLSKCAANWLILLKALLVTVAYRRVTTLTAR